MKKHIYVMFNFLPLCLLSATVTAQRKFKFFDQNSAFLVAAVEDVDSHDKDREACKRLNSDLAVIDSPETLDFILREIEKFDFGQ